MDKLSKAIQVLEDQINYSVRNMDEVVVELDFEDADVILELLKEKQPKKSHWKENNDGNFQCSECENECFLTFDDVFVYRMELPKFCSNCGADMRKGSEHE